MSRRAEPLMDLVGDVSWWRQSRRAVPWPIIVPMVRGGWSRRVSGRPGGPGRTSLGTLPRPDTWERDRRSDTRQTFSPSNRCMGHTSVGRMT